jgi:hypothetical protein
MYERPEEVDDHMFSFPLYTMEKLQDLGSSLLCMFPCGIRINNDILRSLKRKR